jgi:hypothetical protein
MITPASPDNAAIRELRDVAVELKTSTDKANRTIVRLTWVMVVLTAAIFVLTGVLAWVAFHPIH